MPKSFFKHIFFTFLNKKSHHYFNDLDYTSRSNEINNLKIKYKNFLIIFLKILKKKYAFNIFIGFNYGYFAEIELEKACNKLKIPFLILLKERVTTELHNKYLTYTLKKNQLSKFYKIAVYSDYIKKELIKSNIVDEENVVVTGCSRLNTSYSYKKIVPKNQILYYAIEKYRGLPNHLFKIYGKKFFNGLKGNGLYNQDLNWEKLHIKTLNTLKKFALHNPKITIIIKIKTGDKYNKEEYINLPKNMKVINFGTGHNFLKDSKIVIGWNTTSILEGIAANRFLLIPYFDIKHKNFKKTELKLRLKKESYAISEIDFYKKLSLLIKKNYKQNKIYNNTYSLKHHLGNLDNKAGLRLNKFIRDNLNYRYY